jgi:hypothetical protein
VIPTFFVRFPIVLNFQIDKKSCCGTSGTKTKSDAGEKTLEGSGKETPASDTVGMVKD